MTYDSLRQQEAHQEGGCRRDRVPGGRALPRCGPCRGHGHRQRRHAHRQHTDDIAGGEVTEYTDNNGKTCTTEFSWDGKAHYLLPVTITTETGDVVPFDEDDFVYGYYKVVDTAGDETYDGQNLKWIEAADADARL